MITFPHSKINLGLNIVEKRPDGYHNIETVFYPIKLQDALEVSTSDKMDTDYTLHIIGNPIEGNPEDNLVVKAYRLLKKDYPLPPVNIYMYKHIPSGAGLGGGSADAAFMIKLLNEKYKLNLSAEQMEEYAAQLGADCAFFIKAKPVFARGIGNLFESVEVSLKGYYIVLVKPDISVSTGEAFAGAVPVHPPICLKEVVRRPVESWKENMQNDFERTVFVKHPRLKEIKEQLYELGAVYASMTGSGSCIFGIFKSKVSDSDNLFPGCFCRHRELE